MDTIDNYLDVISEDGRKIKAEVIDIFSVEEYPDKDYIIYSFGEDVHKDAEKVYISIIADAYDEFRLLTIEDPKEWSIVQEAIANTLKDGDTVHG